MRRKIGLILTILVGYFMFQAGYERGKTQEEITWRKTLVQWGCAGYEMQTGQWSLTGSSCQPPILEAEEPK